MHTTINRHRAASPLRQARLLIAVAVLPLIVSASGVVPCNAAEQAPRDAPWLLVTIDGLVKAKDVRPGQGGESLTVIDLSGENREIPLDSCVGLMRRTEMRPRHGRNHDSRTGIELHSGDTVFAADIAYKEGILSAAHPFWKKLSFPLKLIRRVRVQKVQDLPTPFASFTGVRFANGDTVEGTVVSIVRETILVEIEAVGKVPVEGFDSIADIIFAPAKEKNAPPAEGDRIVAVRCRSGDFVKGKLAREKDGAWIVETPWKKEPVRIHATQIQSVGLRGTHTFLSDMKPSRVDMTPFIDSAKPWKANESLDGGTMTVNGYSAITGLAMHSRTVLEFPIGSISAAPLRFCCLLGIDAASVPKAGDADFILSADGRILKKKRIVSGTKLLPLYADVSAGSKTLTVTLDHGRKGSAGDYVDVMWAALVRVKKPPEPPAPPPPPEPPKE
ncbi:NPCBM/NEW2 domain-containing protein [Planctomycetota bacterium]